MNVFLCNLPENLVRIVRLKAPSTLESALSIVLEEVNFLDQYNMRNRLHGQSSRPILSTSMGPPQSNFKFGGSFPQSSGFKPILPSNSTSQFKFGIPQNSQTKLSQFQTQPQQFGYRPPQQFGYKPLQQFGYKPPQQFGYKPPQQFGYKPPQQFGYRSLQQFGYTPPQQFGYKPLQQFGYKPPQQFGYTPPQVQPPRMKLTDVSMRTVPPKPQGGFKLNELTLNEGQDYPDYYQDEYYYNEYYPSEDEQNYYTEDNGDETEQAENVDAPQNFCEDASIERTKKK